MLAALKPLLTSKKFQMALITTIANLLLYFGIELDVEIAMALTSPLIAAIFGQTAVDVKKAGLAGLVLLVVACGSTTGQRLKAGAGRVAGDFIDCTTPAAVTTIGELGPAFANVIRNATSDDGKVDGAPVKQALGALKSPAMQCAAAAVFAEMLRPREPDPDAPQSSPLEVDPAELGAVFELLRTEHYDGARYQLEGGVL
jgi:hypothetical protein